MTENNDLPEVSQSSQEPEQPLPGKRLREAREARGLSREGVAAQLRLNVRLITALEEDDYDALPGATFTSGYLRSYARLLELPEDSFVPPTQMKSEQPLLVSTSASDREISSSDGIARLATFVIIGVIVLSVAMWWLGRKEEIDTDIAETPAAVDMQTRIAETMPGESLIPQQAPEAVDREEVASADDTDSTVQAPDATMPAPQDDEVKEEAPAAVAQEREQTEPVESLESTDKMVAVAPVQPAPPPLTDESPQTVLELRFNADSWTEVKDNAGRQLVYRLIREGEVLELRGEAPFHVFLGYAPGVFVYYNDELFDHSPFQRRDVARFRIGRAEHNHPIAR